MRVRGWRAARRARPWPACAAPAARRARRRCCPAASPLLSPTSLPQALFVALCAFVVALVLRDLANGMLRRPFLNPNKWQPLTLVRPPARLLLLCVSCCL